MPLDSYWNTGLAFAGVGVALLYLVRWSVDRPIGLFVRSIAAVFLSGSAILLLGLVSGDRPIASEVISSATTAVVITSLVIASPFGRLSEPIEDEDMWSEY
ncbi:hypothetical protein [Rhodococcus sovatensis]|uniref:Uncharacterized protein n=1 Tax=Rhodococcus sovatensis TaxID=1805840 RepID=A0ABZ2PQG5_9NOCA